MKTQTSKNIIEYLETKGQASAKDLAANFSISRQALHRQLAKLLQNNKVTKIGRPPKVFYLPVEAKTFELREKAIDGYDQRVINERYLYITPAGEMLSGWEGFLAWCQKTGQEPVKTAGEYVATLRKYDSFRNDGLIDGMYKMKQTFKDVFLDKVFYLDFYSIERFGKTKLGQMLLYAKQSQDRKLIHNLVNGIRPQILAMIKKYHIDGVLFVPPTVKREVQLMKELEKALNLPVRVLPVVKVKTAIAVPQKTLNKLEDRVENASKTIVIEDAGSYNNLLVIDDAVGSGATVNEISRQARKKNLINGQIIGLAITGSFKGFDVISEV